MTSFLVGYKSAARRSFRLSRPLVAVAVAFLAGMAAEGFGWAPLPDLCLGGAAFTLVLIFAVGFRFPLLRLVPVPLLLFMVLGVCAGRLAAPVLPVPPGLSPYFEVPRVLFLAEIKEPPDFYPDKARLFLELHHAIVQGQKRPVEGGIRLTLGQMEKRWHPGDRLLARLTLKRFHNFSNPGGYDYERAQARRGLYGRAYLDSDASLVKVPSPGGSRLLAPFRAFLRGVDGFRQRSLVWLQRHLDSDTSAFYAALLLGYRHQLTPEWREHLRRAGVAHLLAISGLHLGLVSLTVFWLARLTVRWAAPRLLERVSDRSLALWAALAAALLYALVSGLALPAWRAALMLVLFCTAFLRYRPADPLSLLAAAALIILVLAPNSLWTISFQLSFGAMIGIFCVYSRVERYGLCRREKVPRAVHLLGSPFERAFLVCLSINVVILPVIAHHFHGISLAGFAANTLLLPVVGVSVLPLGLLGLALSAVHETLGVPALLLGAWFLEGVCRAVLWFSEHSWAFFWVGLVPLSWLVAYYAGLGVALQSWRFSVRGALLAVLTVVAGGAHFAAHYAEALGTQGNLEVTAIEVGQGSSTFVRFPSGEAMLVDGGGFYNDSFDIGRYVVAPFLWHVGADRLDYVVLSHDDADHRNGLRFILSHFDVGAFWETGITDSEHQGLALREIARKRSIPAPALGEILGSHKVGPCTIHVLHPPRDYLRKGWDGESLNNISLVLQIDYRNTHCVLPGDIDGRVEDRIFAERTFPGRVLLMGAHHGSRHSNSRRTLEQLHPRAVVFSCGYQNWFGFPSEAVLDRCRTRAIPHYRTDRDGAVTAVSDGRRWRIRTHRGQ